MPDEIDLESFLGSWYGPPDRPIVPVGSNFDWVPGPLKSWYELSSKWGVALTSTKRFLPLSRLEREGDKYIFLGDQGDWAWAFEPGRPTIVYGAEGKGPWRVVPGDFSEFLLHNAVSEAIWSAAVVQWSSDITEDQLREALSTFSAIEFAEWSWPTPGTKLYMNSEAIASAQKVLESNVSPDAIRWHCALTIGGKSKHSIAHLDTIEGVEWRRR
jgi:hypothetical protein